MNQVIPHASHETVWIPCKKIRVIWTDAQRGRKQKTVNNIALNMDPDALGTILVAGPDEDDLYHCIDGRHRCDAVVQWGGEDQCVPCNIIPAKTKNRCAEIFTLINGGRIQPSAIEKFLVSVTAERSEEVEVNDIIEKAGYHVRNVTGGNSFRAVRAALFVHKHHGEGVLLVVLLTINKTWGFSKKAVDNSMVRGFGEFVAAHPTADLDRLAALVSQKFTSDRLLGFARGLIELSGGSSFSSQICRVLVERYNVGLRKGKLAT